MAAMTTDRLSRSIGSISEDVNNLATSMDYIVGRKQLARLSESCPALSGSRAFVTDGNGRRIEI